MVEMIQRRAARWVKQFFSPYSSVTTVLEEHGLRSLILKISIQNYKDIKRNYEQCKLIFFHKTNVMLAQQTEFYGNCYASITVFKDTSLRFSSKCFLVVVAYNFCYTVCYASITIFPKKNNLICVRKVVKLSNYQLGKML